VTFLASNAHAGRLVWNMSVCLRSLQFLGPRNPTAVARQALQSKTIGGKGRTHVGLPGGGLVVSPDPAPLKAFGSGTPRKLEPAFFFFLNETAYNCPLNQAVEGAKKNPQACYEFHGDDDKPIYSKYEWQVAPSYFKITPNDGRISESYPANKKFPDCEIMKCESETNDKSFNLATPLHSLDEATKDAFDHYADDCRQTNQAIIAENLLRAAHQQRPLPTKDCFQTLVNNCSVLRNNPDYDKLYRQAYTSLAAQPADERGGNPPRGGITATAFK
jgi:hypothetical protein